VAAVAYFVEFRTLLSAVQEEGGSMNIAARRRVLCRAIVWISGAMLGLSGAWTTCAADPIIVGGTGSGSRLLQELANEYSASTPSAQIIVVDPPLGSGGGINALKAGKLQIAISARRLEGKERDGNMVELEFVRTPIVFATRDGVRHGGFGLTRLADVLAGRLANWDDGAPIRLILRPQFDSETLCIRTMSPEVDAAMTQALARKGMVFGSSDLEALHLIEQTPGSLGPTTLGLVRLLRSDVHVLSINGQAPSAKATADGRYPWFKTIYLILRKPTGPEVQAFIDFLQSRRARDLLARTEHIPVSNGN
jgi:phosphate transport system substrate-binding protein